MVINIIYSKNEDWNTFIKEKQDKILSLKIPVGVDTALSKNLISQLDNEYSILKIYYNNLQSKVNEIDKMIYVIEHKNRVGRNECDRKTNGIIKAETYTIKENNVERKVNLYKEQILFYSRLKDIESLIDVINKKISNIITISGLLKIEASLG